MVTRFLRSPGLQIVTALLLIGVLVGILPNLAFQPADDVNLLGLFTGGEETRPPRLSGAAMALDPLSVQLLRYAFWLMLAITLIYAIISPKYRRKLIRVLLLAALLLYVAQRIIVERAPGEQPERLGGIAQQADLPARPTPVPPDFVIDSPPWMALAASLALAVLLLLPLLLLWRRRHNPDEAARQAIADEAGRALEDLHAGQGLRDVVTRCYIQMSDIMQHQRHVRRHASMTPRDFERHLAELGLRNEDVQRLTRLFERVRYSPLEAGDPMRAEAESCLQQIVAVYGPLP